MFYRDTRFFRQIEANGQHVFWSRGNGWVMGALARMLQFIPEQHPGRERFPASTESFGVGAFLLAGCELYRFS